MSYPASWTRESLNSSQMVFIDNNQPGQSVLDPYANRVTVTKTSSCTAKDWAPTFGSAYNQTKCYEGAFKIEAVAVSRDSIGQVDFVASSIQRVKG